VLTIEMSSPYARNISPIFRWVPGFAVAHFLAHDVFTLKLSSPVIHKVPSIDHLLVAGRNSVLRESRKRAQEERIPAVLLC
jgi:hypothetical protein